MAVNATGTIENEEHAERCLHVGAQEACSQRAPCARNDLLTTWHGAQAADVKMGAINIRSDGASPDEVWAPQGARGPALARCRPWPVPSLQADTACSRRRCTCTRRAMCWCGSAPPLHGPVRKVYIFMAERCLLLHARLGRSLSAVSEEQPCCRGCAGAGESTGAAAAHVQALLRPDGAAAAEAEHPRDQRPRQAAEGGPPCSWSRAPPGAQALVAPLRARSPRRCRCGPWLRSLVAAVPPSEPARVWRSTFPPGCNRVGPPRRTCGRMRALHFACAGVRSPVHGACRPAWHNAWGLNIGTCLPLAC